jgi:hypothetical protein
MPAEDPGQALPMNIELTHTTTQSTALRAVQEATAEHARTRRALDAAIAHATAVGVQPEALHRVGQCEPGHGRHAGEVDMELAGLQ